MEEKDTNKKKKKNDKENELIVELNNKIKELESKLLYKDADLINYRKRKDEINVARSIIIRESIYKKLEDMREKYGISISKLVNIAIRTGLESYKNK